MKKAFTLEKKLVATVRYYETLYLVHDSKGERIYTGSEETAKRILAALNGGRARPKKRWEGRTTLARAKAASRAKRK